MSKTNIVKITSLVSGVDGGSRIISDCNNFGVILDYLYFDTNDQQLKLHVTFNSYLKSGSSVLVYGYIECNNRINVVNQVIASYLVSNNTTQEILIPLSHNIFIQNEDNQCVVYVERLIAQCENGSEKTFNIKQKFHVSDVPPQGNKFLPRLYMDRNDNPLSYIWNIPTINESQYDSGQPVVDESLMRSNYGYDPSILVYPQIGPKDLSNIIPSEIGVVDRANSPTYYDLQSINNPLFQYNTAQCIPSSTDDCNCGPVNDLCYTLNYNINFFSNNLSGKTHASKAIGRSVYFQPQVIGVDSTCENYQTEIFQEADTSGNQYKDITLYAYVKCEDNNLFWEINIYSNCNMFAINSSNSSVSIIDCDSGKIRIDVNNNLPVSGYFILDVCQESSKPCYCLLKQDTCYEYIYDISWNSKRFIGSIRSIYSYDGSLYIPDTKIGVLGDCWDTTSGNVYIRHYMWCDSDSGTIKNNIVISSDSGQNTCQLTDDNISINIQDCADPKILITINSNECASGNILIKKCDTYSPDTLPNYDDCNCGLRNNTTYSIHYSVYYDQCYNGVITGLTPSGQNTGNRVITWSKGVGTDNHCNPESQLILSGYFGCQNNKLVWEINLDSSCLDYQLTPQNSHIHFSDCTNPLVQIFSDSKLYPHVEIKIMPDDIFGIPISGCCYADQNVEYELIYDITAFGENCTGCKRGLYWDTTGTIYLDSGTQHGTCNNFSPFVLVSYIRCNNNGQYEVYAVFYPTGNQQACSVETDDLDITVSGCQDNLPVIQATIKSGRCASGSFTLRPYTSCGSGGGGGGGGSNQCCDHIPGTIYTATFDIVWNGMSYTGTLVTTADTSNVTFYGPLDGPNCDFVAGPLAALPLSISCTNGITNIILDLYCIGPVCELTTDDFDINVTGCPNNPTYNLTIKPGRCASGTIVVAPS